ncbi:MAG: hypothetical protein HGB32_06700 [Geobacteraceae bacterium]|nr:hypothetical protein [Geobacteraceae bacterium]NTW79822.1 hypothetical protein [Geobacteraceae bacterium]
MTVRLINPSITAAVICLLLNCATIAAADGIGGYAEYNYSLLDSKLSNTNGITKTKSSSLNQRYSLTLDKSITPTLRLSAMGNFDKGSADNDIDGVTTTSDASRINTNADLSYTNGIFNGGAGFSKRQETSKSNGVPTPTLFSDSYNARFGWKPEDFPSLDVLYSIFNNYDEYRTAQDNTASTLTVSSRYKPHETMDINYSANYSTLNSRLAGLESQSLGQSLRVSYNDMFFRDRISISTSYNIATQDSTTQNNGTAPVSFLTLLTINQISFATSTLSDLPTDFPLLNALQVVNATDLANEYIQSTTTIRKNVGIKSNSDINVIRMPVTFKNNKDEIINNYIQDIDITNINATFLSSESPDGGHKIKVYKNPNSDGTVWGLIKSATVSFKRLEHPTYDPKTKVIGFEIVLGETIPFGTTIKVEIETIKNIPNNTSSIQSINLAFPEVFQQETTPLKPGQSRSSSQISGLYNLNMKAKLLNTAALFYDFGFNLDHTKSDVQAFTYRYTVVNGLNFNHRLSQTLNTSTRVAREDAVDPTAGTRSSSSASISLSSQTLPTLSQSATYGFRVENGTGVSRTSHSMNLSNSAELYRGISLSLSGGGSAVTDSNGTNQKSLTVTSGLNLTPHKTVSINLSASNSETWASATGKPETSSSTKTGDLTATYNPLPAIYLFGSFGINAQTSRKTQTAQSIGGSWAPFRGGALLLNTSYRENIDNSGNKDSAIVQSLRWNIRSGWYLDVSYLISKNSATSQETDTQVFNTALRLSL